MRSSISPTRKSARNPSALRRMLGFVLCTSLVAIPSAGAALEVGQKAPAFSARAIEGDRNLTLSAYRGKIVYLDFWASWCGPCLTSIPLLEKLRTEFPAADFQIVAINVDKDLSKARKFLSRHEIGYPSAVDPDGRLPKTFEIKTMPTSFLIDGDGVIRHIHDGFRANDMDGIRRRIRELMEASK